MREFEILEEFLDFAWLQIARGKADRKSPARCPTFITTNNDGYPRARTLVLRRSNRESDEIAKGDRRENRETRCVFCRVGKVRRVVNGG